MQARTNPVLIGGYHASETARKAGRYAGTFYESVSGLDHATGEAIRFDLSPSVNGARPEQYSVAVLVLRLGSRFIDAKGREGDYRKRVDTVEVVGFEPVKGAAKVAA